MNLNKIIQNHVIKDLPVKDAAIKNSDIKVVSLEPAVPKKSAKTVKTEKPKTKRVITSTNSWTTLSNNLLDPSMHLLITASAPLSLEPQDSDSVEQSVLHRLEQQVRAKIAGYKSQDCEKGLFLESRFVVLRDVFDLFRSSELKCYYCKEQVALLYEYVREPRQWALERLDNSRGHNQDNVVLACLTCNLRRRCMNSDKYVRTKELANIVKVG
jgi:hypothetical protein